MNQLLLTALFALSGWSAQVFSAPGPAVPEADLDVRRHPKGLLLPTPDRQAWRAQHMIPTRNVRPNAFGLRRMNEARRKRGLDPLDARFMRGDSAFSVPRMDAVRLEPVTGGTETDPSAGGAYAAEAPSDAPGILPCANPTNMPVAIDNSELAAFPPIRTQAGGSCTAWACTYYQMTYMVALQRGWDAKNGGDSRRFSPRWTYNLINDGADTGSFASDALRLMQEHGAIPYDRFYEGVSPRDTAWPLDSQLWRDALAYRMGDSGTVPDVDTEAGLNDLKQMLVNGYVLTYSTYQNSWKGLYVRDDPGTTDDDPHVGEQACYYVTDSAEGAHRMTVIGYNDAIWIDINRDGTIGTGERGALKVANSWGTDWGNDGFLWLAYDALKPVSGVSGAPSQRDGAFTGEDADWLAPRAFYAPKLLAECTLNTVRREDVRINLVRAELGALPPYAGQPNRNGQLFRDSTYSGGDLGFDGLDHSTNPGAAPDCTFFFDYTDLAPDDQANWRYVVKFWNTDAAYTSAIKSLKLVDVTDGDAGPSAGGLPQTSITNEMVYASVEYVFSHTNTPPTLTAIADAGIDEDTSTAALPFTVGDAETAADALSVVADSDNHQLVPGPAITLGGSGSNRTVTVTPAADRHGTAAIVLTVADGYLSATQSFTLTVSSVNDAPVAPAQYVLVATNTGRQLELAATDADGDALTFHVTADPTNGVLSGTPPALTYVPGTDFAGGDAFTFEACDAVSTSAPATVWIEVREHDIAADLLGHWRLDAGAGDTAVDASGHARHGELCNEPAWTNGRLANALSFDEADDYVAIPDFAFGPEFTVSFWYSHPDNAGSVYQYMYSHGNVNDSNSLNIWIGEQDCAYGSGFIMTALRDSNDPQEYGTLAIPAGPPDGTWHLYTLTVRPDAGATLYFDGVAAASSAAGGDSFNPAGTLYFGGRQDLSSTRFYGGRLDDLRIYGRALLPEEVQQLYQADYGNLAPAVFAGADQTISLSTGTADLAGGAWDDGLPAGTLETTWTNVSGPASVSFGSPTNLQTTATFTQAGDYILRLSANDGALSGSDELSVTVTQPAGAFTAYNDLAWATGQLGANITAYTRGESGLLVDYHTGTVCAVTLTIDDGGSGPDSAQGTNALPGTDAYDVFAGIVDCAGLISYGSNLTFTFSGMNAEYRYEFALFGNRDEPAYTDRRTTVTISDVDAFLNASSSGAEFGGPTDASTGLVNGYNTTNGHVARFTTIDPGTNGTMLVTVSSQATNFYVNALMLRCETNTPLPELAFDAAWSEGAESNTAAAVGVSLNRAWPQLVTVAYNSAGGTAQSGADYASANGVLTFPAGQTAIELPLAILDDDLLEDPETVVLTLSNPSNATLAAGAQHTVIIADDDENSRSTAFVAYNDLLWAAGQTDTNLTVFSGYWPEYATNGVLVDLDTGAPLPVTLSVATDGSWSSNYATQGTNAHADTDAFAVFNGKLDCTGNMGAGQTTLAFAGLDPGLRYTLVLFANRDNVTYTDRLTSFTLSGAVCFRNRSSSGSAIGTAAAPQDTTTVVSGYNTESGHVARFEAIDAGDDGALCVSVGEHGYLNALMLEGVRRYGLRETVRVPGGAEWRYARGTGEASSPAYAWRCIAFDDSGWSAGAAPIGYSSQQEEGPFGTTLDDMADSYSSVFLRRTFTLDDPWLVRRLTAQAVYDDGFILWLNGEEIARINIPGGAGDFVAFDSFAASTIEPAAWTAVLSTNDVPALHGGTNVVAVQVFNSTLSSSDLVFDLALSVVEGTTASGDQDGDGLPDAWENAVLAGTSGSGADDFDNDGVSNLGEYIAGTAADGTNDWFAVEVVLEAGMPVVRFATVQAAGTGYEGLTRYYMLEQADGGPTGPWNGVDGYSRLPGTNQVIVFDPPAAPPDQPRCFRARVWLEE
ncbi:MAG: hypothetical protein JXR37_24425 [Kiritimatiellae bacterium]|nr:hypothetical protein [Kiritimatiellia bacterium]